MDGWQLRGGGLRVQEQSVWLWLQFPRRQLLAWCHTRTRSSGSLDSHGQSCTPLWKTLPPIPKLMGSSERGSLWSPVTTCPVDSERATCHYSSLYHICALFSQFWNHILTNDRRCGGTVHSTCASSSTSWGHSVTPEGWSLESDRKGRETLGRLQEGCERAGSVGFPPSAVRGDRKRVHLCPAIQPCQLQLRRGSERGLLPSASN